MVSLHTLFDDLDEVDVLSSEARRALRLALGLDDVKEPSRPAPAPYVTAPGRTGVTPSPYLRHA